MGISVGGLASGIDTKSLIQQLITVERQPQLTVKRRQLDAVNAASAIGELKSLMSTVQDKARELDGSEEVSVLTATSSDEAVLTADVLGTARPGIFNISVESMASAQKDRVKIGDSLTTEVEDGEYTIEVEGGDVVSFELDEEDATLSGLVTAINSADAGVVATTIYDGNDYHLSITARETGKAVSYGRQFDNLDFVTTASSKAEITIDGLKVSHEDNIIEDVVTGVTLNLNSLSPTVDGKPQSLTLQIEEDADATAENVKGLVDAMNALASKAKSLSRSSEDGAGVLAFDSSVRMMRSRLSDELVKPMAGVVGDTNILSMIGIGMDRYGSITFDANEFKEALADDFDGTISLIANSQDGLAARMKTMADDYNLTEGVFTLRKSMYQSRSKELERRVDRMEERVLVVEARLKRQFASMERMMSGLQQQQGALSRL
ncbi:MAG TPA: hypothetical protein DEB46_14185 [Myxococcales bacterium]|nr:hypothetical protein [Myxococcales bacterium]|tara:strand:+ start:54 stop:1358 length:1305 start_codon:yes stop_codon:yes gene_type:complete